ncbi:YbhN family protein [Marivita sp. S0852]|uniref:lysylphosphatidylglycerol synthase transmembrane domain-containing protein n=1 Tax=Marivita sp. S0852 TaxID=3373893 RepID=UPI003982C938
MRLFRHLSPTVSRVLQLTVFAGLIVLVWYTADGWAAVSLLHTADPVWLMGAVALLTLQTVLSAQRWRITADQLGLTIPFFEAIREYYLAQVVNQSLPGGILGDAGRAVRARKDVGLMISGQAVVFERLAGQIGLLMILLFGLGLSVIVPVGFTWPVWVMAPLGILFTVLIIGLIALVMTAWRTPVRDGTLGGFAASFMHATAAPKVLGPQIFLSLSTAFCNIGAFAFCAAALGLGLPVLVVATLVPLILFAMVIPLSIGGWGFREGAAALLFPVMGAAASEGLATSVAFGLAFLLTVLPGLLLTWLRPIAPVPEQQ